VAVTVIVAVVGPVIVAVHVHGNATVGVIERFPKRWGSMASAWSPAGFLRIQQYSSSIHAHHAHRASTLSITFTVAFPCTCTATITGPTTATITATAMMTICRFDGSLYAWRRWLSRVVTTLRNPGSWATRRSIFLTALITVE
jgi:hypothetical protein